MTATAPSTPEAHSKPARNLRINGDRVLETFLQLVRIESPSGHEAEVAAHLLAQLSGLGFDAELDKTGNVVGTRPGIGAGATKPPVLLSAHMDTVSPGYGVSPVVVDGIVRSSGATVLGADDKAGVASILEALRTSYEGQLPSCPVEVAFTVEEETGLTGAKGLDTSQFKATHAVVLDSNGPVGTIVNQAPAADSIKVVVHGTAAHAGVSPEKGVSAIQAAARALAKMKLGRIDEETTGTIGLISGGTADNIIPDRVEMSGGARSRSEAKLNAQIDHMRQLFEAEAAAMGAHAEVTVKRSYGAIDVPATSPLIVMLDRALRACGLEPRLVPTGGGSDASVFNDNGIEAVNLGVGFVDMHSTTESIAVADLAQIAEVVLEVITV
jgi:tripeptide aminopeptidase